MRVVFDFDGTLSLPAHRLHLIRGDERDYDAFYAACGADAPYTIMLDVLSLHLLAGDCVSIWTGRRADAREQSQDWLARHGIPSLPMLMRPVGDTRPTRVLKEEWLKIAEEDGACPQLVYEDREDCAAVFVAAGVTCLLIKDGGQVIDG